MSNSTRAFGDGSKPEGGSRANLFVYYQTDQNGSWQVTPEEDRAKILTNIKPRYMTALATTVQVAPGEKVTREAKDGARYRGDFYIDWDSKEDLQVAIAKVNEFLEGLERLGVDLHTVRLYCSGSKGFHAEVPAETFMKAMPVEGIADLPAIYKEMMFLLYTETMDANVYSSGRGRMWRVPNVQRENGRFKVAVTLEEMRGMTVELYEVLVSASRPMPARNTPVYSPELAKIYKQAFAKVGAGRDQRRKPGRDASQSNGRTSGSESASDAVRMIQSIADAALEQIDALLPRWLPGGSWEGPNYVGLNPRRADRNPGSFKIHQDGFWKDYAEDTHKGGDLVALKRFLDGEVYSMGEAARRLAEEIGFTSHDTATQPNTSTTLSATPANRAAANVSMSGGTNREPVVTRAMDLLAKDFPPINWVVEGVLPEGLSLLAGSPKTGKSWMVLEIALAVASGGTCLGGRKALHGRALYLALEDNQRRLKDRIMLILSGGKLGLPEKMDFALEWPRLDQGGMQKLGEWLSEHPDARLVVIDTLAKIRKKQNGNSNLYTEDYEVGAELKQLSDKYHVAVVLVTHVRKAESQDPLEMVTGTLGLVGGMDGILVLKRERGQGTASLYVTGRDVPEDQYYGLNWNKECCRWAIEGSAKDLQMGEARKEVVSLLGREKRPLPAKEIADMLGRKHDATRRLLPDMVEDGLIDQRKDGQRWLYVHPLHAGAPPTRTAPAGAAATSAPTPPTLLSHGGVLGRARAAGLAARAAAALTATIGGGATGGAPVSADTGGSGVPSGSDGNSGSAGSPVPEFSNSFETSALCRDDVPPALLPDATCAYNNKRSAA